MTPHALTATPGRLGGGALAAYGALGAPLAMAALPLYVHLPKHYSELGLSLTLVGALLLALRLGDAVLDPLLGAWSDRGAPRRSLLAWSMPVLAIGMVALFLPLAQTPAGLATWLGVALAVVYLAFSVATINHSAWGAELSVDPEERTRITATREAMALAGVVVAAVVPTLLGKGTVGLERFAVIFAALAAVCTLVTLRLAPAPPAAPRRLAEPLAAALRRPLANVDFRHLLAVFVMNGIAAAIPSQLVLFYVADVLGAEAWAGAFLAAYFVAGAASMPLWVRLSARLGKVRAWLLSMGVAIAAFVWAAGLGAGDVAAFAAICVLSGFALGADLALPPSLLADVIGRGRAAEAAGSYFGLWTLATKANLALAAGIALPLVSALGYTPGVQDGEALRALAIVYAFVPCVLKALAIATLLRFRESLEGRDRAA
jgi:Na+/melibiose symporter-like transporter